MTHVRPAKEQKENRLEQGSNLRVFRHGILRNQMIVQVPPLNHSEHQVSDELVFAQLYTSVNTIELLIPCYPAPFSCSPLAVQLLSEVAKITQTSMQTGE